MKGTAKNPELQSALAEEAKNRAADFLSGILRYIEAPQAVRAHEAPYIWKHGNARVLDYGSKHSTGAPILFIPSLINRYYILDLEEERSLLRYMSTQGFYPLVLDWGAPGDFEQSFGCGDYITEILTPAIEFLSKSAQSKIALAGYCMGGNLALAAAQLQRKYVSALALLATPWDFHCTKFKPFVVGKQWHAVAESLIASQKTLPGDIIQSLFYMTDPFVFEQKFRRFASLSPESRSAKDFIALERWVNDGVPMTANVARDCLIGWAQKNEMMIGQWQVAGKKIDLQKITQPTFIAMPQSDHVVPLDCAMPLAQAMPQAKTIRPGAGHVGMIVGHKAKKELWQPLAAWLRQT